MLDDQKYIDRFDTSDALGVIANQLQQLNRQFDVSVNETPQIQNVVIAGMGGSALAASFLSVWLELDIPLVVVRSYNLPHWVSENTLVIASSYSGNTEETLSALNDAQQKKCQIAVISAGGKLAEIAKTNNYPFTSLSTKQPLQPRMAVLSNLKALVSILEAYKVISGVTEQLEQTADRMNATFNTWLPSVPTSQNQAKQIAEHLVGKTPIVYGGLLYPAAYKWKINFNENAKNTAWCGEYSEFNHNEFIGWSSHPVEKPFGVIDLISKFDHPQVQKRFMVSDKLLSGKRPKALQIASEGENRLEELLWSVALGDMVSVYLALLNSLDPTPVELIEKLKMQLSATN